MKRRVVIGILCCVGLLLVFLFQRVDLAGSMGFGDIGIGRFIINRTIRFLINDAFAIGLIYALFSTRKYVLFAIYVQLFGVIAFLIPYFVLKVYFPSYNGPYINFLHRLILNPTLLLLLIPAFYYQKYVVESDVKEE
ncbi:exosortase F system-associated protein [Chryseolinea sp. T2]|uniref:exosortase F system-associated membrane protein n=1 Tax=Chryseolinea sp. T2 TaxID=3129255 RepID=UPI003077FF50